MGSIFAAAVVNATLLLLLACCLSGVVQCQEPQEVRASLVEFLRELAGGDEQVARDFAWDASVDPCGRGGGAAWTNVTCDDTDGRVRGIRLEGQAARLNGTINATLLCAASAIHRVSLQGNALRGGVPAGIASCKGISHLYLGGNRLSGDLPSSLAQLGRLRVLDVSRNNLSGEIPGGLSKLGIVRFLANDNRFSGTVPDFDLTQFKEFNVSNNNLTGPIPKNVGRFGKDRFWPNAAGMCGQPMFAACQLSLSPSPPPSKADGGHRKSTHIVMYLGYVLLGAVVLALAMYLCFKKQRRNKLGNKSMLGGRSGRVNDSSSKVTTTTTTTATSVSPSKSVYSLPTSVQQSPAAAAAPSTSLVVLRRSGTASITSTAAAAAAKELRFEDLLKSPAELLGRGRFGSSYKVVVPSGAALAVKRVKDAAVSEEEFRRRMERVGRAKHLAVLPPLAFYCAMQEKLVVYEFQSNGSLARLLHGSIESSQGPVDWPTRLQIAGKVAEGMAFMHASLSGDGTTTNSDSSGEEPAAADGPIAHGNLKTSNILFTSGMDPCISEYGVTAPLTPLLPIDGAAFHSDVRAFGVVLLELLTGKATVAQGDGAELARWVTSVIREEWTAEVFDRAMLAGGDGSSEQRMVRLLQVAMRCVDASPGAAPPTMREVAGMINAIREEDDRSISSEA
ncbi:hypothetical protein EJB05_42844, partial [Eragrostis curvula]